MATIAKISGFSATSEAVSVLWRNGKLAKIRFDDGDTLVVAAELLRAPRRQTGYQRLDWRAKRQQLKLAAGT